MFIHNVQGDNDNVFNLTEKQKNERYVQRYDVCDRYKSEVIPKGEVLSSCIFLFVGSYLVQIRAY